MGLLQPEMGLLFWMCLAFGVVLFVLCKWGFPMIVRSIEERKKFIDSSIEAARKAQEELKQVKESARTIMDDTQVECQRLLREVAQERDKIIGMAKEKAEAEGSRIIAEAKHAAEVEREEILRETRSMVASLAIAVSERLLRENLHDEVSQTKLVERLLDEMDNK